MPEPVLIVIVIIGAFGGVIGGIWAAVAVRAAATKPARVEGMRGRVLRAGPMWWSTGVFFGFVVPVVFILLMFSHIARTPGARASASAFIVAGLFALGGAVALSYASRYRVYFDPDTVEYRSLFRRQRALRWADVTHVSWLPLRSQLLLRGSDVHQQIRVGVESGFLDFIAAVEEHVPVQVRGNAVELARRSARGSSVGAG